MKSYQQIAGDGTTDRATPATASPAHTPEPWSINAYEQWDKFGPIKRASIVAQWDNGFSETLLIATVNTTKQIEANAARIVACVNACAGMVDPSEEIARLRAAVAASRALHEEKQERALAALDEAFGGEAGK